MEHGLYFKTLGLIIYSDLYYSIHTLQSLHLLSITFNTMGIMTLSLPQILAKNKGFEYCNELFRWAYGAKFHFLSILHPLISIFTDAGLSRQHGIILHCFHAYFFYTKNLFLRLFYLMVGYGRILWSVNIRNPIGHS